MSDRQRLEEPPHRRGCARVDQPRGALNGRAPEGGIFSTCRRNQLGEPRLQPKQHLSEMPRSIQTYTLAHRVNQFCSPRSRGPSAAPPASTGHVLPPAWLLSHQPSLALPMLVPPVAVTESPRSTRHLLCPVHSGQDETGGHGQLAASHYMSGLHLRTSKEAACVDDRQIIFWLGNAASCQT